MVEQIYRQPDIYQVQVDLPQNPLKYLNSYIIKGKTRNLVIDTGFNRQECHNSLWQGLQELHLDFSKTDLFLTHLHSDHTGLVGDFVKAGCKIYMGEIDYNYMQDSADGKIWDATVARFCEEGMPSDVADSQMTNQARIHRADPHFPAHLVHDGDILHLADQDFQVIHAPGHTKGLCCLYLPEPEIFFTSDHILFDITPNITVWYNLKHALKVYLDSLDKVRNIPVKLALPGHRKGDTAIAFRVDAIKKHHAARLEEALYIVKSHPGLTGYEIASHMSWSMRGKKWKEFPPTQKWFAMGEALSHLEYLLDEGKIKRCEENNKFVYEIS